MSILLALVWLGFFMWAVRCLMNNAGVVFTVLVLVVLLLVTARNAGGDDNEH